MSSITLKKQTGADAGTVELDDAVFGLEPNVPVMHQVVVAQLAAARAGTQSTKTRAEVSGGGAKPFKQKGTGRARAGSTRSPNWRGGGVALGPKPRKYDQRTPKKMINLALRSALSDRAAEGKVVVVDQWNFATPKTKDAVAALASLGVDGKALVVVDRDLEADEAWEFASRAGSVADAAASRFTLLPHARLAVDPADERSRQSPEDLIEVPAHTGANYYAPLSLSLASHAIFFREPSCYPPRPERGCSSMAEQQAVNLKPPFPGPLGGSNHRPSLLRKRTARHP